jgi:hypothetical protein
VELRARESRDGKVVVRIFFVYAGADQKEAGVLRRALENQLGAVAGRVFVITSRADVPVGAETEGWVAEQLRSADLVLVAESPALVRDPHAQHELKVAQPGQLRPIVLKRLMEEHDRGVLQGLKAYGPPFPGQQKEREAWCQDLAEHLLRDAAAGGPLDATDAAGTHRLSDLDDAEKRWLILRAAQASMRAAALGTEPTTTGVLAVQALLDWLDDPAGPPLFALLGDVGTGKTITCQRVVRDLERAGGPLRPVYVDLRWLRLDGRVPTLEQIIDTCLARNVLPGQRPPSASELLRRAEREPLLWVFDGLDEALVHLTAVEGTHFTRELLRLRESLRAGQTRGRLLLSCRTHYFRSLEEERAHFRGQDRGGTDAVDYQALTLLPLTEADIREYLAQAVQGLDRKSTRLNSSHRYISRMPSSA